MARTSTKRLPDHMIERDGRYSSRVIVPVELRSFLGKSALWKALGGDLALAKQRHKIELGRLQQQIGEAEQRRAASTGTRPRENRYPLTPEQMARQAYGEMLRFDAMSRAASPFYAGTEIDWEEARRFRDGYAGKLSDDQLEELVGAPLEEFRVAGNHAAPKGSTEWRVRAQLLCYARLEMFKRQDERDEGNFAGQPDHPMLAAPALESEAAPVSLVGLLDRYLKQDEKDGQKSGARKRWTPVFENLKQHLKHDDAVRLTKADVIAWLDARAEHLAPKTIADVYLASLRAVLTWAHENELIPANPAAGIKRRKPKKVHEREKGFTQAEALEILKAARDYQPAADAKGKVREHPELTAAKRWTPWLAAFTGARIAELTQLRKQDVRQEGNIHYLRLTPEAGSVKSGQFRDVPLHPQLVDRGFLVFVEKAPAGPLFFKGGNRDAKAGANMVAGRVTGWLQEEGVIPEGVQPNHAWRHRMKTVGEELGVSTRVLDAIQGHAARTAGENYGDVTLKAKQKAIDLLPQYNF